jgi:type I site-specific restriction-modification system R (restriction) subunit
VALERAAGGEEESQAMTAFTESVVEDAALTWLKALGYAVLHGPDIAAGEPAAERSDPDYRDVLLEGRLRQALVRLNSDLPHEALEDAYRKLRNVVQARSFAELLEQAARKYQNRAIETAQVIEELIQLAKDMRAAGERGEQLGLSEDELAFYDALETNDSAVKVLGDDTLRAIARELVATVRNNVTIDWTIRENVRAQLRVLVKRILRKHGYPPDKQEKATQTVLEQAEVREHGLSEVRASLSESHAV